MANLMSELTEEQIRKGWDLLRKELPANHPALKQLNTNVYGVSGLTDVAEWYLWEALEQSNLPWELVVNKVNYIGSETRQVRNQTYSQTWYLVSIEGVLIVGGKPFPAVGASENRRLDAAYKGALTSMFKNGCKWAGLTMWLYKGGKIIDSLDEDGDSSTPPKATESRAATTATQPDKTAEAVQHAVASLDGKVVSGSEVVPQASASPIPVITADMFAADEVAQRRVAVLEAFNKALPTPNADAWVKSTIGLFIVRAEQNQLTSDMISKKSPINWAWNLLITAHNNQCKPSCQHIAPFFEQLKAVK